ncbi:hypothetical protein CERZMDRAFT_89815 [Cercospora zeae-maydis SCOH1-5]|uniref:Uncharacterized protein n=1 Tax=Cercospora zeae-maydis SCOH1-5 TaxID=717836 RepID=A0A6A6FVS9_9PEZI|nr:hypothetical protein CERZMDRAFT_89815 [Cercospora zeae-maydis SCOH1-5]
MAFTFGDFLRSGSGDWSSYSNTIALLTDNHYWAASPRPIDDGQMRRRITHAAGSFVVLLDKILQTAPGSIEHYSTESTC